MRCTAGFGRGSAPAALLSLAILAACAGAGAGDGPGPGERSTATGLATQPYLVMTDARSGWAVWPSGEQWLVLHTDDGWAHVTNRTPAAVPTGGGLVLRAGPDGSVVVAVGAYDRLVSSPVLTRSGASADWLPDELPGAVSTARESIAASPTTVAAIVAGGESLLGRTGAAWGTIASSSLLAPGSTLHLEGITWADDGVGWLTGSGSGAVAFRTGDGGQTWAAVPSVPSSAVAALAPCGAGASWLLPVLAPDGTIAVLRTSDGGLTWVRGAALRVPAEPPVWGCHGAEIWMTGLVGGRDDVFASVDSGATWLDRGPAPAGLTDLTPVGTGSGFAAAQTAQGTTLWSVTGAGKNFTRRSLPSWVASIGNQGTSTS